MKKPEMDFHFDVKLKGALRVRASSYQDAIEQLEAALDCATADFGLWDDGRNAKMEVSLRKYKLYDVEVAG